MRTILKLVLPVTVTLALATPAASADALPPAFAGKTPELIQLDSGVVLEGDQIGTPDGHTSGFRVAAGYSPFRLPSVDLGAELSYRQSDEVPTRLGDQSLLLDSVSIGGSVVAGVRVGRLGLYAKSGIASWEGSAVMPGEALTAAGTTRTAGLGARLQFERAVSRFEVEEFNAPGMSHLNLLTASLHVPF